MLEFWLESILNCYALQTYRWQLPNCRLQRFANTRSSVDLQWRESNRLKRLAISYISCISHSRHSSRFTLSGRSDETISCIMSLFPTQMSGEYLNSIGATCWTANSSWSCKSLKSSFKYWAR
jgi:hypothetical protein